MKITIISKFARRIHSLGMPVCSVALGLTAIGCNHTLNMGRLDLEPSSQLVVGPLTGCRVTLVNNQPNTEKFSVGGVGIHRYEGSLHQLTDALVSHLAFEFEKRNAVITTDASRVLKLKVESVEFQPGFWTMGTEARVRVETGRGYVRNLKIETATAGTVNRLYEGMVQIAVTEILKDPAIAGYLR